MAHHETAAVFNVADLPAGAQAKSRTARGVSDLSAAQQTTSAAADVTAIVEADGSFTILAPSGHVASAMEVVRASINAAP